MTGGPGGPGGSGGPAGPAGPPGAIKVINSPNHNAATIWTFAIPEVTTVNWT